MITEHRSWKVMPLSFLVTCRSGDWLSEGSRTGLQNLSRIGLVVAELWLFKVFTVCRSFAVSVRSRHIFSGVDPLSGRSIPGFVGCRGRYPAGGVKSHVPGQWEGRQSRSWTAGTWGRVACVIFENSPVISEIGGFQGQTDIPISLFSSSNNR